jgi:PAS domain-containing protein
MADQKPVEMILLRQVASYLTLPIWMMDAQGNLLYYNEPAEKLLGVTFDDAGPIHAAQLTDMFRATDVDGNPIEDTELPVVAALVNRAPASGMIRFCGLDGIWRDVDIWAMPVQGQAGRFLGVFATFWESQG